MTTDTAWVRAMRRRDFSLLLLLLAGQAMGQMVSPTNDTASLLGGVGFLLTTILNNMNTTMNIAPLTNAAGLNGQTAQLQQIIPTGPLYLTNGNTVARLTEGDIAYISCEDSDYTGTIGSSRTIGLAVNNQPSAIVFYSTMASRCNFNPGGDGFPYTSLYTMTDANSSSAVVNGLNRANPPNPMASIHVNLTSTNATTGDSGGSSNILGRSPTTAVAMIILYSITGIITALFLIIIVVGAVRAHRHPERYGPRRIAGRPRQSRAKGIARAMLETIPIVKFGDVEEENKAVTQRRDIELTGADANHERNERDQEITDQNDHAAEGSNDANRATADDERPKDQENDFAVPKDTVETGTPAVDSGLACSVCVEDFEKGQDIRVLPCKHKFHPECIDPWLLNVSGTCPLCRVDLRPAISHGNEANHEDLDPTPELLNVFGLNHDGQVEEASRPHRRSRIVSILNIGRMREATPEERLDALRRLRDEGMINTEPSAERSRRRFSHRWSRAFGSRPTSTVIPSRPVSEVPEIAVEPPATAEPEAATHEREHASSNQETSRDTPPDLALAPAIEPSAAEGIRPATPSSSAPALAEASEPHEPPTLDTITETKAGKESET